MSFLSPRSFTHSAEKLLSSMTGGHNVASFCQLVHLNFASIWSLQYLAGYPSLALHYCRVSFSSSCQRSLRDKTAPVISVQLCLHSSFGTRNLLRLLLWAAGLQHLDFPGSRSISQLCYTRLLQCSRISNYEEKLSRHPNLCFRPENTLHPYT